MQATISRRPVETRSRTRSDNGLVSLATPVLEEIMRVKAGLVTPSIGLRSTIDGMLKEVEERGDQIGYKDRQLQTVKFVLAAFVDETVLIADFPLREEWEKYPLQLEYVGEQLAGLTFFERLDEMMKSGGDEADADVIEVCYLCLLLGYRGKYNIYYEDQVKGVIENVADHLRRAGRLRGGGLSPHWKVTDQPEPPTDPGLPGWAKLGGGTALALVVLIYMILSFLLSSELNAAKERLLR
ncbi:MAG TPA: type IVB secretion system protein IcmH/DotU [Blastocatellia bacterium]|nr:type IVB secretion system protein IcmH/DotU [Blastocatellia bacterium]